MCHFQGANIFAVYVSVRTPLFSGLIGFYMVHGSNF